jgi:branched-chain amino acid transport system permease protein
MSALYEFIEFSLLGLFSGGVLALIGLSFVLVYKGTRVINFATGDVMMLGAYLYHTCHVVLGWPLLVALALAIIAIAVLAFVIERAVLRPLSGQSVISVLMATIGISSIIHGLTEVTWGGDTHTSPSLLPRMPMNFGEVMIPGNVFGNFALAAALITAFLLFFRYSRIGVTLRAAANDPVTACTMGIDIRNAQRLTWMLAGTVGTVAGVLIAATAGLSPLLATTALSVFAVIILGGLDSIVGAILAGLLIGWLDGVMVGYVGGKVREVVPYVVVLAILVVRPYGLFGTRTIERL